MNLLPQDVADYIRRLCDRYDHPILLEMEALAEEKKFPIVNRMAGSALEVLARSIGARRVFELGSGFGYSAFWFASAVGQGGEVNLTDGDQQNTSLSQDFLARAGLADRCRFLTGDAVGHLDATPGDFDVVYCDIDKQGYPNAWEHARERIRPGGLYLCDNALWSGRVADPAEKDPATEAIRVHNQAVFADDRFMTTIIPIRDGIIAALRIA
jgi:predicted O-methyltransferase YrrM